MRGQIQIDYSRRLPEPMPDHDGETYRRDLDRGRLNAQASRVWELMSDGGWRTLDEIAAATGDPPASVSARLRDFRKEKWGARIVQRRRRAEAERGIFEYRVGAAARAGKE